jgi:hypothetical protein
MSYGKKDEDADLGLVKVDRTQVFQEGTNSAANALSSASSPTSIPPPPHRLLQQGGQAHTNSEAQQHDYSTALQSSLDDAAFC